jgi:LemA protein
VGWLILIIIVVVGLYLIALYNRLVTFRNRVDNAWAQVDVQLRRRYDLVPNLVETVKGYAAHEKEIFEAVAQARQMAISAQGPQEKGPAENQLTQALRQLFAVAEAYPVLRASENFQSLQGELAETENKIAYARQFYNDTVYRYNTTIEKFPANLFARSFGFTKRDYFAVEGEGREPVRVQF